MNFANSSVRFFRTSNSNSAIMLDSRTRYPNSGTDRPTSGLRIIRNKIIIKVRAFEMCFVMLAAVINIFFGFGLYIDQNPLFPVTPVAWIMFAYVMFHIFSEAVLQTHSQLRVWQQQQRIKQCGLQIREHAVITKDISHNYDLGQVSSIKAMDSCASDGTFGKLYTCYCYGFVEITVCKML